MPLKKLTELLDKNRIKYDTIKHSPAYTASETAQSAHVSGREFAKVVMVKIDGKLAMVVVPANTQVNFELLRNLAKAKKVELANERDFEAKFPECELGAMPVLGNLFGLTVYASNKIADSKKIVFNAGSHTELIKMNTQDFINLVQPQLIKAA